MRIRKAEPRRSHARRFYAAALGIGASLALAATAAEFSDANWTGMGGIPGPNGPVFAVVADDSGNLYIGGYFTVVGDVLATNIAKWDGSNWSPLGLGMNNNVNALAVSGSDLYAGGAFTTAGGSAANYIAKWNGNSWSALSSGMNSNVNALALSGSDLYVGGQFLTATNSGGQAVTVNGIAKWDGSSWSALGSGMGGVGQVVNGLAVSGSHVYAGGYFTLAGGSLANYVAKWDGSSWSALGAGMNDTVNALVVSGTALYAGGAFTRADDNVAIRLAKWDGSSWSAMGSAGGGPGLPSVYAFAVSGTDIYAGGGFTSIVPTPFKYIAKWNGSTWSALGSGMDNTVFALATLGTNLFAGGGFTTAGGSAANSIARWDGSSWSAMGSGMNTNVLALTASGSDLYAGGGFTKAGSFAPTYVVKWNGSSWSPLGSGMNSFMLALAVSGSDLYAGGSFTWATNSGGLAVAVNGIAKWDGSSWSALGSGLNGVSALAASGNDLYVGGAFTTATNSDGLAVTVNRIAKWDGSGWSALGSGMDLGLAALATTGSDVYAGGFFNWATNSSGPVVTVNRIAKWNGSSWTALGLGMNSDVRALVVSGNDLYAGGTFTTATNSSGLALPVNRIAKWDGSSWSALGAGMNERVFALVVSGSELYAGGSFTWATNSDGLAVQVNGIAKWNGNSWSALGSGVGNLGVGPIVRALSVTGGDLYAGGRFTTAGGKVSAYVARAYLPSLPTLSVLRSGPNVTISWPSADTAGFALEQAGALAPATDWVTNTGSVTDDGLRKSVNSPATNSAQFFRLRRP